MLTPATITVNFTANYAGPHRICWRQCNTGDYVCTNIVDCVGGGNVCTAVISIMVDPESCDTVCFEGYIQATCNPEDSSVGRVFWSSNFTPNPACKMYALACTETENPCTAIQSIDMGLNCNGTARPTVGPINPSSEIYLCSIGPIANLPAGYTMTETSGCCYNCTNYAVTVDPACPGCVLDGSSMYYIDCQTRELVRVDFTGTTPYSAQICAVTGSISFQLTSEALGGFSALGVCP